jgi:hypothetical protein
MNQHFTMICQRQQSRNRNQNEVDMLRKKYGVPQPGPGLAAWLAEGIREDLATTHQIQNASRRILLVIAKAVSLIIEVKLGRNEKRQAELLIGWFKYNYDKIRPLLNFIVIKLPNGELVGPLTERWVNLRDMNPEHEAVKFAQ